MRHALIPDEMRAVAEPLLPDEPPEPKGGRPSAPNRDALRRIVFVLRSGLPWEMLPREVFGYSGMTLPAAAAGLGEPWAPLMVWMAPPAAS